MHTRTRAQKTRKKRGEREESEREKEREGKEVTHFTEKEKAATLFRLKKEKENTKGTNDENGSD